jgi:hypothetical protein
VGKIKRRRGICLKGFRACAFVCVAAEVFEDSLLKSATVKTMNTTCDYLIVAGLFVCHYTIVILNKTKQSQLVKTLKNDYSF